MFEQDNFLYISYYSKGLRILDVLDPENPIEVAYYDTPGQITDETDPTHAGSWGVYPYLPSGNILLSDRDGLRVFQPSFRKSGAITSPETWTNYIHLVGDVTVSSALTIEAGTVIRVEPNTEVIVDGGRIDLNGTSGAPIVFEPRSTTATRGFWDGITFIDGKTADFIHVTIRKARNGLTLKQTENSEGVYINNLTIEQCYTGLKMEDARHVNVLNSTFQNNEEFGVWFTNSNAMIDNSVLQENGIAGAYCYQQSSPSFNGTTITQNGLSSGDARWSGVYATISSHPTFTGLSESEALACQANNWIDHNGVSGVIADGESFPLLGIYDQSNPYPAGGYNRLYGNQYDVVNNNQSGDPIYAQVNYWGFDPREPCIRYTPSALQGNVVWDPVAPCLCQWSFSRLPWNKASCKSNNRIISPPLHSMILPLLLHPKIPA